MMNNLSFETLRKANLKRLPQFRDAQGRLSHPMQEGRPAGFDWTLNDWFTATAGEVGEVGNLLKKIRRGDISLDNARGDLAKELADVAIYLDLLANRAEIDLGAAIVQKFNEVSRRVSANVFLESDRCDRCGWPLKSTTEEGCTKGNCSQRS